MLLKNKEGNCLRSTEDPKKIETLKALGYTEVKKKSGKSKNKEEADGKGNGDAAPQVTEEADGSVTVDM